MKLKKLLIPVLALSLTFTLFGCSNSNSSSTTTSDGTISAFDNLGGGQNGTATTATNISNKEEDIDTVIKSLSKSDITEYNLDSATIITSGGNITSNGTYLITGTINLTEAISFTKKVTSAHLIIKDATINITDDKAISSKGDL